MLVWPASVFLLPTFAENLLLTENSQCGRTVVPNPSLRRSRHPVDTLEASRTLCSWGWEVEALWYQSLMPAGQAEGKTLLGPQNFPPSRTLLQIYTETSWWCF